MSMRRTPKPRRKAQGEGKQIPIQGENEAIEEVAQVAAEAATEAAEDCAEASDADAVAQAAGEAEDFDNTGDGAFSSSSTQADDATAGSPESAASGEAAADDAAGEAAADEGAAGAGDADAAAEDEAAAGAGGADAAATAAANDEALAKAQAEAKDWQDKFMRLHAEWDTYRRRTGEQREQEKVRATEKLVNNLIPVLDDFERTVDYADKNGEEGLLDGVKAVHSKLVGVLTNGGVEVINPAGEAFNALEAQAVATVPDDSVHDETVHEVYQKGYKMGTKVLRPAMVTVTTGGPKRPKEEPEE